MVGKQCAKADPLYDVDDEEFARRRRSALDAMASPYCPRYCKSESWPAGSTHRPCLWPISGPAQPGPCFNGDQ